MTTTIGRLLKLFLIVLVCSGCGAEVEIQQPVMLYEIEDAKVYRFFDKQEHYYVVIGRNGDVSVCKW